MSHSAHLSRRFLFLRLLSASLVAAAIYDLGFAVVMIVAPQLPGRWLGLPLPGERFYLWLIAVLLAMLAAVYLLAAHDPRRYSANIAVAIAGRFLGALAFALATRGRPELSGLWVVAAGDLAFSLAHTAFWWPVRA